MKKHALLLVIFCVLTAVMTFPLVFQLTTHIPGFFSSDEPHASLWDSWRVKFSVAHHLSLRHFSLISYPEGAEYYTQGHFNYLYVGLFYLLSVCTTPILTFNIQILLNFLLTGACTYVLVWYLTKNKAAAFISAVIFAFCPYQFVRSWQHLGLTYNQWIPLVLCAAVVLRAKESSKAMMFFIASVLLLLSFDYTILFLGSVALATWAVYVVGYSLKHKCFIRDVSYIKKLLLAAAIVLVILSPQLVNIVKNRLSSRQTAAASVYNSYRRPFADLYPLSARPLSYVLPTAFHPLFGSFTEGLVGSDWYGTSFTEHTLYLGWVPLILAFLVAQQWRRDRKKPCGLSREISLQDSFHIGFFIFLAFVAWLFSQPPTWRLGPLSIPMPSLFMYKLFPMYRSYSRFGVVLELAIAVLAGFSIKYILEKHRALRKKVFILTAVCCAVLFEFCNWPPYKVIEAATPPQAYAWLARQPGQGAIAQYPMDNREPIELYRYYQMFHHKPVINFASPGTSANADLAKITDLSKPETARALARKGVKYAFVWAQRYMDSEQVAVIQEYERIAHNPYVRLLKKFPAQECPDGGMCVAAIGAIDVYEVGSL